MMTRNGPRYPIIVPDLGLPGVAISVSVWLVPLQASVEQGDRVVEIEAGDAIVDLPAPASGLLVNQCVAENGIVQPGDTLGEIQATSMDG